MALSSMNTAAVQAAGGEAAASKKAKVEGSKDDLFGEDLKKGNRKRTEEGYAIYRFGQQSVACSIESMPT
jgi:hypothetical protein